MFCLGNSSCFGTSSHLISFCYYKQHSLVQMMGLVEYDSEEDQPVAPTTTASSIAPETTSIDTKARDEERSESSAADEPILRTRLGDCEVCGSEGAAKYTCPGCSVRFCAVACSKSHKLSTGCTGVRNAVAPVSMTELASSGGGPGGNSALASDFRFLQEVTRQRDSVKRMLYEYGTMVGRPRLAFDAFRGRGGHRGGFGGRGGPPPPPPGPALDGSGPGVPPEPGRAAALPPLAHRWRKLLEQARLRGVDLLLMPAGMSRHDANTSRWAPDRAGRKKRRAAAAAAAAASGSSDAAAAASNDSKKRRMEGMGSNDAENNDDNDEDDPNTDEEEAGGDNTIEASAPQDNSSSSVAAAASAASSSSSAASAAINHTLIDPNAMTIDDDDDDGAEEVSSAGFAHPSLSSSEAPLPSPPPGPQALSLHAQHQHPHQRPPYHAGSRPAPPPPQPVGKIMWRVELLFQDALPPTTVDEEAAADDDDDGQGSTASNALTIALDAVADTQLLSTILAPYIAAAAACSDGSGRGLPVLSSKGEQELRRRLAPYAGAVLANDGGVDEQPSASDERPRVHLLLKPPFPANSASSASGSSSSSSAASPPSDGTLLDPAGTLQAALRGRTVLEFPTVLVRLQR